MSSSFLTTRIDWKNPRQFGKFVGLLWALTVFGTLVGFLIQAAVGARAWSGVTGDMLPVLLGASIGYGLLWAASALYAKRHPTGD
ncbi:hypothetical protein [Plantibacter sp. RU18]|uniref:hypothetical protein n=1 Tax=Plantibacter sp. RU18 TaxID=3158143 RepID=UPI003D36E002